MAMKNLAMIWTRGIVAAIALTAFVGCGDSGGSSKARGNKNGTVGVAGCAGCGPNGSNVLYSGLGNSGGYSTNRTQMALDFYLNQGQTSGVFVQGELYSFSINQNPYSGCSIPVGSYNVTTEQVGNIDNYSGAVSGVRIVANGPAQVKMTILDARFFQATPYRRACNSELFASDMYTYVQIDSINGFQCSYSTFSLGYNQQFTCQ